jgi:hypothetical protein
VFYGTGRATRVFCSERDWCVEWFVVVAVWCLLRVPQGFYSFEHVAVSKALDRFAAALVADGGDVTTQDAACDALRAFVESTLGAMDY